MSKPTAEAKDPFDEFFDMAKEVAIHKAEAGEITLTEALISKDRHLTVAVIMVPTREIRGYLMKLVDESQADCYAVTAEMWVSQRTDMLPMNDPESRDGVIVVAYHRDGRAKEHSFFLTKDRKVIDEPGPAIFQSLKDKLLGGNVFATGVTQ